MTLPTCHHRGPEQHPGYYICASNRIIHFATPGLAPADICTRCPYTDRPNREGITKKRATGSSGPGTELKKLLSKMGINPKGPCLCNQRAMAMDQRGLDWCEKNIEKIVGWMKEEAHRRRLPSAPAGARLLVKRAIRNSRRSSQK